MSDLPPDLPRLRTLETYLQVQLRAVQQQIAHLEQQAAIRSKPEHHAPPAAWLAEYDISAAHRVLQIHTGDCAMTGGRTRRIDEQAARAGCVEAGACQFCRPDTALGILD